MRKRFVVLSIISMLFLLGCADPPPRQSTLPTNAKIISIEGDGWVVFEFHGDKFLYHKGGQGYRGFECLTVLPK